MRQRRSRGGLQQGVSGSDECALHSTQKRGRFHVNKIRSFMVIAILGVFAIAGCSTSSSSNNNNGSGGIGPTAVNLKTAGNYVILAKTTITNAGTVAVVGDMGLSPGFTAAITNFGTPSPLVNTSTFQTSNQVTGDIYAADMVAPTPTILGAAILDMQGAYTDAAGRTKGVGANLNIGSGTIPPSTTLAPGTYTWGSNVTMPSSLTLSGGANDTWLFQVTGTLTTSSGVQIILGGSAVAKNIVWQVSGAVTLGAGSVFNGIILGQTAISLGTTATVNGRLLAQSAVTLTNGDAVNKP
jgi:hypothetical protein